MKGFQEIAAAVQALPEPAALATLARVRGSSYRQPGARTVFDRSGIRAGVFAGRPGGHLRDRAGAIHG
jgi:xanthine/CO dehydrogenase XdhC/CoxF family maturation factor